MKFTRNNLNEMFTDLNELTRVDLIDHAITELDANTFKGLANLTYINLHNNQLEELHPNTFNGLKHVISIRLYKNKLNHLHKNTFRGLKSLIKLSINNNLLQSLDNELFSDLENLVALNLSENKLLHLDKSIFNGLASVSKLTLSYNQLKNLDKNLFSQLVSLRNLILNNNNLTDLHEDTFSGLRSLASVALFNNKLNKLSANTFRGLAENLAEINLYYNQLEEIPANTFNGLVNLIKIGLGCNKLKQIPADLFKGLERIEIILLDYNQIASLDVNTFKGLFSLERIILSGNLFQNDNSLELCLEKNVVFVAFKQKWNENNINLVKRSTSTLRSEVEENSNRPFYNKIYKQIEFLGEGSFGRVYRVENVTNNREYALKMMLSKFCIRSQETQLLTELKSPYLIQFVECFFETVDFYCIVTEYCQDGDLSKQIETKRNANKKFKFNSISLWALEMIYGIEYLHSKNVVHRDLKPGNVFLDNGHIKLGDLGSATHKSTISSSLKTYAGTPIYMSPEIIRKDSHDFKTDVWSTGLILFELITLEFPFKGDSIFSIQESILRDNLPDLIHTPLFDCFIKLMLCKKCQCRVSSFQLKCLMESIMKNCIRKFSLIFNSNDPD